MTSLTFIANGKPRAIVDGATVADFLQGLALAAGQVLVEYNGEPLERDRFTTTLLKSGDNVEVAQMVGGG